MIWIKLLIEATPPMKYDLNVYMYVDIVTYIASLFFKLTKQREE